MLNVVGVGDATIDTRSEHPAGVGSDRTDKGRGRSGVDVVERIGEGQWRAWDTIDTDHEDDIELHETSEGSSTAKF